MKSLNDVLNKLNDFLNYSKTRDPNTNFDPYFAEYKSAVNSYFNGSRAAFERPLYDLQITLYDYFNLCTMQRGGLALGINEQYEDLRLFFYDFNHIFTTNESFYNAWVWETDAITQQRKIKENSLLVSWLADLQTNGSFETELQNLQAYDTSKGEGHTQADEIILFEEISAEIPQPTSKEAAIKIFKDMYLLECVQKLGLPVHIPSYIC